MGEKTVLVFGAGFTKSFFPAMPLLIDSGIVGPLRELAEKLPTASRVLDAELKMMGDGTVNIERLMTRLDSGTPYDRAGREQAELRVLLSELKTLFSGRIAGAKGETDPDLAAFARVVIRDGLTCVTFNYDDVLDEYLFGVRRDTFGGAESDYWTPDSGYGFATRRLGEFGGQEYEPSDTLFLKLHGSVNWRIRRGHAPPHPLDEIVLAQSWFPEWEERTPERNLSLEAALEPEPLIVAPVLLKHELQTEPLFKLVWSHAFSELSAATEVVFVGYSLPPTDLAARALFSESITESTRITIVTRGKGAGKQRSTMDTYRLIWPNLSRASFEFRDARSWAREFSNRPGRRPTWFSFADAGRRTAN